MPHPRDENFDGSANWNLQLDANPDLNPNLSRSQFRSVVSTPDNWVGPVVDDHLRDTASAPSQPDEQVVSRYLRSYNNLMRSSPGSPDEDAWAGVSDVWYGEANRRGIGGRNLLAGQVSDQAAKRAVHPDPDAWGVVRGRSN